MASKPALSILLLAAACSQAEAATQGNPTVTSAGTDIAIALPVLAGGLALYNKDWDGALQLGVETLLTVGTAYGLEHIVREKRPDGSDFQSFPSDTTALASSGAAYLWGRYGWEYGLPAFAATGFVAYSRVQAGEHHWYDTLASSAISIGYSYFVVTRYHPGPHFYSSLSATPDSASFRLAYTF